MTDLERLQTLKLEADIMVCWITPDIAAKFVEFVDESKQRRKRNKKIDELIRVLIEGHFQYNGDTLRFSSTGRLIDGQNRCYACIQSGVPFLAIIVQELSDDAFGTIDQGKPRTFRDLLKCMGIPNAAAFAPVVAHILDYENGVALGGGGERKTTISNDQRQAVMERHPGIGKSVKVILANNKEPSPGIANRRSSIIAAYYFASQSNPALANSFVTGLLKGCNLSDDSPILALRQKLLNSVGENKKNDTRLTKNEAALLIFKALNLHLEGSTKKLQRGGDFPSVVGYDKFGYRKGLPADAD